MSSESQIEGDANLGTEVQVPSTPLPSHATLPSAKGDVVNASKAIISSPPPRPSSADLTPPPSSQVPRQRSPPIGRNPNSQSHQLPASPPATVRANHTVNIPSAEEILGASEQELRSMVTDLVAALREARMSAAHFKLQHSLLSLESHESAQRAEIEHQMTKREVEVLQADNRTRRSSSQTPKALQASPQSATEHWISRCRELELEIAKLDQRLENAKQLIEEERDRADLIQEEKLLLKKRIRENRDHYTRLKMQNPAFASPRHDFATPQRKLFPRFPETGESQSSEQLSSQDPFAVLLAADQVMNGEPISVPSTPARTSASKVKRGHTRGAYSLSSIQSTPTRSRPSNQVPQSSRIPFSAPSTQFRNEPTRHDRDSTISVSDEEAEERHRRDAITDDEFPQSQASSLATSMLRRNPGPPSQSQDTPPLSGTSASAEKQSTLLQAKLFGNIKKTNPSANESKRRANFGDDDGLEKKRSRIGGENEAVGLGIGSWGSPRR